MAVPLVLMPCDRCGAKIATVNVPGEGLIEVEPRIAVYTRESDGEGGQVWLRVPANNDFVARHQCPDRQKIR